MTRILMALTACLFALTLSCGSEKAPSAATPGTKDAVAVINLECPIKGEAVEADGGTTVYKGQTIGFCCKSCVAKFEALDDAGKVAALEKSGTKLPQ